MIESILAIFDRLIELLDRRSEQQGKLLTELVDPVFAELTQIHINYRGMLDSLLSDVHAMPVDNVITRLAVARRELEHLRDKNAALSKAALKADLPEKMLEFMWAAASYFRGSVPPVREVDDSEPLGLKSSFRRSVRTEGTTGASCLLGALNTLARHPSAWTGREAEEQIRSTLDELEWKWQAVVEAYASARVSCIF